MVKQRERVDMLGHVAGRARVEVPPLLRLDVAVVAASAEEDVCHWLMEMKTAFRQLRRGIDIDFTDPRHQQSLLIVLTSEVHLLLLRRTAILCPVPFLAAVVTRVAVIIAAFRQLQRGIDVDFTDPRHQQRLLIVLTSEVHLLLLRRTTILCPVPFLAAVVTRVAVVIATATAVADGGTLLLLLIVRSVLAAAFAGAGFGAALTGSLVHPRQPLLLSEQQFAARIRRHISVFFIHSSFNHS
jgi:hypothetical protein